LIVSTINMSPEFELSSMAAAALEVQRRATSGEMDTLRLGLILGGCAGWSCFVDRHQARRSRRTWRTSTPNRAGAYAPATVRNGVIFQIWNKATT
jgi:hypothetical protein